VNKRMLTATANIKIQAAEQGGDGKRRFELTAYTGEPLNLGWWQHPVVIDCATLNIEKQSIPCLLDHSSYGASNIVGQCQTVTLTDGLPPLKATGIFTPGSGENDAAKEVLARADSGFQWEVSVGAMPGEMDEVKAGNKIVVNGREYAGPCFVARNAVLREISFVILGADRKTSAIVATHHKGKKMNDSFEQWLTAHGLDASALNAGQLETFRATYDATIKAMEHEGEDKEEEEKEVEAEDGEKKTEEEKEETKTEAAAAELKIKAAKQRMRVIAATCESHGNPKITVNGRVKTVLAHAMDNDWSLQKVQSELLNNLRASRSVTPNVIAKSNNTSMEALQGAFLLRAGGQLDHKSYQTVEAAGALPAWLRVNINDSDRNRYMEAAHKIAKKSAVDIARESLRASGRPVPDDDEEMIQAAFSSGSLTNVMTTSVNAILLARYMESADTTKGWVYEGDLPNYLTAERVRVVKGTGLSPLPEDGEADHMSMSDAAETFKGYRYAGQFQIDEIAIINDNLGAIKEKPIEMADAAARIRPDAVYATLLANPTLAATARELFNSTEANLITSSALSESTLATALARMSVIRENGVNIDVEPTHLIVPPKLRETARRCIGSPYTVGSTTANALMGALNTLTDWNLNLVMEKRLQNGVSHPYTGTAYAGSETTWFVASSKAPAIEVAYVKGQRTPRVRTTQLDKGKFGVNYDVSLSLGVCVRDWKGIEKITG
jgi:Mu-like prophage major head subunit gpT